jgi:hypothetical protein
MTIQITNRKAHGDPICMAFPLVTTILGVVFLLTVTRPSKMSGFEQYLLFGFVVAVLLSVVVRTLKHGLGIVSMVVSFIIFAIALLMLRMAMGTPGPSNAFFIKYIFYLIPLLMVGVWADLFLP